MRGSYFSLGPIIEIRLLHGVVQRLPVLGEPLGSVFTVKQVHVVDLVRRTLAEVVATRQGAVPINTQALLVHDLMSLGTGPNLQVDPRGLQPLHLLGFRGAFTLREIEHATDGDPGLVALQERIGQLRQGEAVDSHQDGCLSLPHGSEDLPRHVVLGAEQGPDTELERH
jgi:hypothetical protein